MKPFNSQGAFLPLAEEGVIRRRAVKGAGVTIFSQAVSFLLQMASTVVLARLLAPTDFGLVALVSTVSLLLMNCGLNGFTEAVVQRDQIDHTAVSNVFWINTALGVTLAIVFASAGSLLARFYVDPRIAHVALAMSLTIVITSLSVQHLALLKRAMLFAAVSANDVIARLVAVVVGIVCAWIGWGYWALVAAAIALQFSTSAGAWILCRWIPGLPQRHPATMPMVRFAISTYGRFITNYLTNNLDNFLVGWRLGPLALGFYKKAYDLFVMPANQVSSPISSVAVSALSRLDGKSPQYRRYLLTAISVVSFLAMAISGCLTLIGKDLIRVILGTAWAESGRIFTFFGPGVGMMMLNFTHGWVHISLGRADRWLRWGIFELSVTASLFIVGLHWGAIGVASAWVVSYWMLAIPAIWYAGKPIQLAFSEIVSVVWRFIVAAVVASLGTILMLDQTALFASDSDSFGLAFARVVIVCSIFTIFYLAAVILVHGGLAPLQRFMELLHEMLPSKLQPVFSGLARKTAVQVNPAQ